MRSSYDMIADAWNAHEREFRARDYVDRIVAGLEPGAMILDVGCGTGIPIARYLVTRGFRVTGLDASERMLEIARRAVPDAVFLHAGMVDVELSDTFSAVVAWDSIFHVDRRQHGALFRRFRGWLDVGGRLLMSAGGSGDAGFTSEMFGQTFFYSGFEPQETVRLVSEAGFDVEHWEVDDPSSREHIVVIARVPAPEIR